MTNLSPDAKFRITLGLAISTIAGAAWAGWRFNETLTTINTSIKDTANQVNARIDGVESRLIALTDSVGDRWTKTAAAEWSLRMLVLNPTLKIPDPRDPSRLLNAGAESFIRDWIVTKGSP